MAGISDEVVEEVRSRADIVQIIGEAVTLKKVGRRMVGLCPFHADSKPSFYVNADRGAFKCFGCGIGGDVFRFVMETQRLTFPEAVRLLADRYGIEVPETSSPSRPKGYRDRLLTANEAALSFFRERLANLESGRVAREYLQSRGTSQQMIDRFELCYAPDGWDHLCKFMQRKGIALQDAADVGLIAAREKGDGYYDRFRHRLMFPVRNATGKLVAFSGRLLAGDGPKYMNSPESEVFVKGRTFYGLHLAAREIGKKDIALVCEGNFDVVSLHQYGFDIAVAALGTAFTENHAALLERYTKNAVFIFDGDEAGQKAMMRLLEIYLNREEQPKVVVLPEGDDPDSFLKARGAEKLADLIQNAPHLVDFAVDRLFATHGRSAEGTARSLDEACLLAARLQSPIRRGLLAKRLATRTAMPEETIREQIDRARRGRKAPVIREFRGANRLLPGAERTILATLLHYPTAAAQLDRDELLMALPGGPMQNLAERILRVAGNQKAVTAENLMRPDDDEETRSLASELLMLPVPCEPKVAQQALADALLDRKRRTIEEELESVKTQLAEANDAHDEARVDELTRRHFALVSQLSRLR